MASPVTGVSVESVTWGFATWGLEDEEAFTFSVWLTAGLEEDTPVITPDGCFWDEDASAGFFFSKAAVQPEQAPNNIAEAITAAANLDPIFKSNSSFNIFTEKDKVSAHPDAKGTLSF